MTKFEAQQQGPENPDRTRDIEQQKRRFVKDQGPENPEKTKQIEEAKRKQQESGGR